MPPTRSLALKGRRHGFSLTPPCVLRVCASPVPCRGSIGPVREGLWHWVSWRGRYGLSRCGKALSAGFVAQAVRAGPVWESSVTELCSAGGVAGPVWESSVTGLCGAGGVGRACHRVSWHGRCGKGLSPGFTARAVWEGRCGEALAAGFVARAVWEGPVTGLCGAGGVGGPVWGGSATGFRGAGGMGRAWHRVSWHGRCGKGLSPGFTARAV
jgi:hypothetical protein